MLRCALALALFLLVVSGCAVAGYGISLYPGGNRFDPNAGGFDPKLNFFCDATEAVAINGMANPGATWLELGLLLLCFSIVPTALLLPALFPAQPRVGSAGRWSGCACALSVTIGFVSVNPVHDIMLLAAGVTGLLFLSACGLGLMSTRRRHWALLSVAVLLGALIALDSCLYGCFSVFGAELTPALPATQKPTLFVGLLLELMIAIAAVREPPASASAFSGASPA